MAKVCEVCGKGPIVVNSVIRRGKARREGGVGRKTTGITKRVQKANLHKKLIRENGVLKRVWLSAAALRTLNKGPYQGVELACRC